MQAFISRMFVEISGCYANSELMGLLKRSVFYIMVYSY